MDVKTAAKNLGIDERIRRSPGRHSRNLVASAKVTREERDMLEDAAKAHGKALSEWAREVLLREARSPGREAAIFTEVVALRKQLNIILRSLVLGEKMTPEAYTQVLDEVRTTKHETAQDLLKQYASLAKEQ